MSELLSPHELDVENIFHKEFVGMTEIACDYNELCNVRTLLIQTIQNSLQPNEKDFLISVKLGKPQWNLMPIEDLSMLPGIRWKVININKMKPQEKENALRKLQKALKV